MRRHVQRVRPPNTPPQMDAQGTHSSLEGGSPAPGWRAPACSASTRCTLCDLSVCRTWKARAVSSAPRMASTSEPPHHLHATRTHRPPAPALKHHACPRAAHGRKGAGERGRAAAPQAKEGIPVSGVRALRGHTWRGGRGSH